MSLELKLSVDPLPGDVEPPPQEVRDLAQVFALSDLGLALEMGVWPGGDDLLSTNYFDDGLSIEVFAPTALDHGGEMWKTTLDEVMWEACWDTRLDERVAMVEQLFAGVLARLRKRVEDEVVRDALLAQRTITMAGDVAP